MAEFGGGWFDPWGDKLFGGAGYDCQAARESGGYERDYYLTAMANGIKIQNIYMTFGGTNWGWLPRPGRLHVLRLRRRLERGPPAARGQGHGDEGDGLHGPVGRAAVDARHGRHGHGVLDRR